MDPVRIGVAGCWHANSNAAIAAVHAMADLLADEPVKLILHTGDFGYWPDSSGYSLYLRGVNAALVQRGMELWFIDGNHENHDRLSAICEPSYPPGVKIVVSCGAPGSHAGICWLRRGTRWEWHGRSWLALGGAVSVDRVARTEGFDWFPREEISDEQEAAVIAGGHADVMLTHDCPGGVRLSLPPPPSWWDNKDLARADAHRERLQRVTDAVRPSHLIHGHYHMAYAKTVRMAHGPVSVTGLDMDGEPGNWAILDVETMEWET